MDLRLASEPVQLREMIDRMLATQATAVPGRIDSFDAATQTAAVTPAIPLRSSWEDRETFQQMPQVVNVPIVFPFASTAGWALTLPVQAGDPCLLIFSQRAIDRWHETGSPEEPALTPRHHSLTDAFALLAPSPLPGVLGAWQTEALELRNRARDVRVTLSDSKVEVVAGTTTLTINKNGDVEVVSSTAAKVTAPLTTVTGNLLVTGTIVSQTSVADPNGTMQAMRDTFNLHTHEENGDGGGTTDAPNQLMEGI